MFKALNSFPLQPLDFKCFYEIAVLAKFEKVGCQLLKGLITFFKMTQEKVNKTFEPLILKQILIG